MVYMCEHENPYKWVLADYKEVGYVKQGKAILRHNSKWICPTCGKVKTLVYIDESSDV